MAFLQNQGALRARSDRVSPTEYYWRPEIDLVTLLVQRQRFRRPVKFFAREVVRLVSGVLPAGFRLR